MASRVNTKFVIGLSVALLAVFGLVAVVAQHLYSNRAADLIAQGDKLVAAGKFADAEERYSKAVNKDQTNSEALQKWIAALRQCKPETQVKYEKQYRDLLAAVRQQAVIQKENVAAQREFLDTQWSMVRNGPFDTGSYSNMISEADTMIKPHAGEADGPWQTLLRFRGMAAMRAFFEGTNSKDEQFDAARTDLETAVRADPTDTESTITLVDSLLRRAARAHQQQKPEEAATFEQAADAVLAASLEKNPEDSTMLVVSVGRELNRIQNRLQADSTPKTPEEAAYLTEQAGKEFDAFSKPLLERAFTSAQARPQPLPEVVLMQLRQTEALIEGVKVPRTEELIRAGLREKPTDAALLMMLADLLAQRGDYADAVDQLGKVTELPVLPIGSEGFRLFSQKRGALALQALWSARIWAALPEGEARTAAQARARELREKLAAVEDTNSSRLLIVDAQDAFYRDSPESQRRAAQLFDQYLRAVDNRDTEALLMRAQVSVRLNEFGRARDLLEQALKFQPTNVAAILLLGDLEGALNNFEAAATHYSRALRLDDSNENAKRALQFVQVRLNRAESDDPVVTLLLKAQELERKCLTDQAACDELMEILRTAFAQHNQDVRIAIPLMALHRRSGNLDQAKAVYEAALAKNPDSELLKRQGEISLGADPFQVSIKLIKADPNLSELDKLVQMVEVSNRFGHGNEARGYLDEAFKLGPDDKRVVELRFNQALSERRFDDAAPLVEAARKGNFDDLNGDSFEARLLAARGEVRPAINILRAAIARGGAQPELHRLLGRLLMLDNKRKEATDSFREALKIRPNDAETVVDLINALLTTGDNDQALAVARQAEPFAANDPAFVDAWVAVEALGGDREKAIGIRERLHRTYPENRDNSIKLAALFIDNNRNDRAKEIIDKVRLTTDDLDVARLDALIYWRKGERDKANAVYTDFAAKHPDPDKAIIPIVAQAQFLSDQGEAGAAIAVLESGRSLQDKKTLNVDRAISDLAINSGRLEEAAAAARTVVSGNADTPEHLYQKRIVEALTNLGRLTEAQKELDILTAASPEPDMVTLILAADLKAGMKDEQAQRDILNQAVARFPNQPLVFLRRGQVLAREDSSMRDAVADFSKVLELSPDGPLAPNALRSRARAKGHLGDAEGQIADLRGAIRMTPGDSDLLFGMLNELIIANRAAEAIDIAADVAKQRPRDVAALNRLGSFFLSAAQAANAQKLEMTPTLYNQSRRFYKLAFEQEDSNIISSLSYIGSLLAGPQPDIIEADAFLKRLGAKVGNHPGLKMSEARVRMFQGKAPEAGKLARESARVADPTKTGELTSWYNDLRNLVGRENRAETVRFLDETARAGIHPEWMKYFRGVTQIEVGDTRNEGMRTLIEASATAKNPEIRQQCYKIRGNATYQMNLFEEAATVWTQGTAEFPNDIEMLNNAAYCLAAKLDKPQDALPLAQRAREVAPGSADIADTLGFIYLRLDKAQDAVPLLEEAFARSTNATSAIPAGLHLTDALIRIGKTEDAKLYLYRTEQLMKANPNAVTEDFKALLQELRTRLGVA